MKIIKFFKNLFTKFFKNLFTCKKEKNTDKSIIDGIPVTPTRTPTRTPTQTRTPTRTLTATITPTPSPLPLHGRIDLVNETSGSLINNVTVNGIDVTDGQNILPVSNGHYYDYLTTSEIGTHNVGVTINQDVNDGHVYLIDSNGDSKGCRDTSKGTHTYVFHLVVIDSVTPVRIIYGELTCDDYIPE